MLNQHSRSVKCALRTMSFMSVGYAALIMFLSSCSAGLPVHSTDQQMKDAPGTQYSIVCVIHGDGDYLYHDTSGNEFEADKQALAAVIRVAQQNPNAEVFIFHQKPRQHFLLFFPLRDGEFYYYRNGRLVANELYWRDQQQTHPGPEAELYHRFHAYNQSRMVSMFLYFGHEIPEFGGAGYDASYGDRTFTVQNLAGELKDFTRDSSKFDLMILSTCFGGTPYTIGALGLYARTIIASPDNLHLSYFNLHSLEHLDSSLRDTDVPSLAKTFAQQAFDRLTSDVQTTVSIAVYDVNRTQEYTHSVHSIYDYTLAALKKETEISLPVTGHCDCAELPAYVLPSMNQGVYIFYRPASFGRSKNKPGHSGWECWQDVKLQDTTLENTEPVQK